MLSRPEFEPSPANADRLIAEINRLGHRGNVYEMDQAFWNSVMRGEIIPKEIIEPVSPPTRDEAYDMLMDELRKLAEGSAR
jgi:hypothetical protein